MVRFKSRWLLIKVELYQDIQYHQTEAKKGQTSFRTKESYVQESSTVFFPSKKDFLTRLRHTITWHFGLMGNSDMNASFLLRFCDYPTRLILLRCPREHSSKVRAALTLLLTRSQLASIKSTAAIATTIATDYVCSVLSVHGSTRTAKIATLRMLRTIYRNKLLQVHPRDDDSEDDTTTYSANNSTTNKRMERFTDKHKSLCEELQQRLVMIQDMD